MILFIKSDNIGPSTFLSDALGNPNEFMLYHTKA